MSAPKSVDTRILDCGVELPLTLGPEEVVDSL